MYRRIDGASTFPNALNDADRWAAGVTNFSPDSAHIWPAEPLVSADILPGVPDVPPGTNHGYLTDEDRPREAVFDHDNCDETLAEDRPAIDVETDASSDENEPDPNSLGVPGDVSSDAGNEILDSYLSAAVQDHPDSRVVINSLVALAVEGNRRATGELLAMIHPIVLKYCRARLGRQESLMGSADDVTQDVCMAVLDALPKYQLRGLPFRAFVYGIAAHKVTDVFRAIGRNRAEPKADMPDTVATADGPEHSYLAGEGSKRLGELLDILTPRQRAILVLRLAVGLSAEETARAVHSTPGAVRVGQHRALGRLRRTLSGGGEAEDELSESLIAYFADRANDEPEDSDTSTQHRQTQTTSPLSGRQERPGSRQARHRNARAKQRSMASVPKLSAPVVDDRARPDVTLARLLNLLDIAYDDTATDQAPGISASTRERARDLGAMVARLETLKADEDLGAYLTGSGRVLAMAGYMAGIIRPVEAGELLAVSYRRVFLIGQVVTERLALTEQGGAVPVDSEQAVDGALAAIRTQWAAFQNAEERSIAADAAFAELRAVTLSRIVAMAGPTAAPAGATIEADAAGQPSAAVTEAPAEEQAELAELAEAYRYYLQLTRPDLSVDASDAIAGYILKQYSLTEARLLAGVDADTLRNAAEHARQIGPRIRQNFNAIAMLPEAALTSLPLPVSASAQIRWVIACQLSGGATTSQAAKLMGRPLKLVQRTIDLLDGLINAA